MTGTADTSVRAMEDVRSPTLDHPGQVSCLDPVFLNPLEDPALEPHESVRTATGLSTASVHEHCYFHSFNIQWIRIKKESHCSVFPFLSSLLASLWVSLAGFWHDPLKEGVNPSGRQM